MLKIYLKRQKKKDFYFDVGQLKKDRKNYLRKCYFFLLFKYFYNNNIILAKDAKEHLN